MKWIPIVMAICAAAWGIESKDFRCKAEVQGEFTGGSPVRVNLSAGIMVKANERFSDLRLMDDSGQEVPFVIYERTGASQDVSRFSFKVAGFEEAEGKMVVTLERPQNTGAFKDLEIHTAARDFKKMVLVEAGNSPVTMEPVGNDTVFDFASRVSLRKTVIDLPVIDCPYVRLTLMDEVTRDAQPQEITLKYDGLDFSVKGKPATPFRIEGVSAVGARATSGGYALDTAELKGWKSSPDKDGNTVITAGDVELAVSEVVFTIENAYYYRNVRAYVEDEDKEKSRRPAGGGVIYRIPGMNKSMDRLALSGGKHMYLRFVVINGDNPPLRMTAINISWVLRSLYFVPEKGKKYTVYCGMNKPRPPDYELRNLLDSAKANSAEMPEMKLGAVTDNPDYQKEAAEPVRDDRFENAIFSGVIIVLVIIVGVWVYRLVQKLPSGTGKDGSSGSDDGSE
jgi:hypothetical protein